MAFKRKPAVKPAPAKSVAATRQPAAASTARRSTKAKGKEREFLREVEPVPVTYELARPVRVVFRLSEAEAEKLRATCFEKRQTTQAYLIDLLVEAGVCEAP